MKKEVLLHICCGVCAIYSVQKLKEDGYSVKGYFYNPNIYPYQEYQRRLDTAYKVAELFGFDLIQGPYEEKTWTKLTEELKDEPEGGRRCKVCFRIRLAKTYDESQKLKIPFFTSTLSISPHKNTSVINNIGEKLSKKSFLKYDFKKQDGFKKTIEFAKKFNLYRQNYCGCVYSMENQK